jgi:hypothetical protein
MINTDTVMRLTHRALFGKESCMLFVGIKLSGALLQVCAATSLEAALWSAIPWVGSLFVDVVWYAAPVLLKKIVQVMPLEEVRLRELAISVMVRLRLRFSIA